MTETYDAKAAADVGAAALVRECIEEDRRVAPLTKTQGEGDDH